MTDTNTSTTGYLIYSVFKASSPLPHDAATRREIATAADAAVSGVGDLTVRGWYDVAGFRADADLMAWWWSPRVEDLQEAYHAFLRSALGAYFTPVWSQIGTHRPAEFNREHVPSFLEGHEPKGFLCVYPFVRSHEWYLLPAGERAQLLRDHGLAAADYKDVLPNTVSSFGLGDYEWLLGFEADSVDRIVDLMRDLRATDARRHVREEVPFYTGPRMPLTDIAVRLP